MQIRYLFKAIKEHKLRKKISLQSFDQSILCEKICFKPSKLHTGEGEKPYKCSTCDRSFTYKKYFITHQRSHTGEKPYQSCSCDKAYANKVFLEGHQITHTEKKNISLQSL